MPISEQERQIRRDRIHRVKPWLHSTGPRSPAGKARSSLNSWKTGLHSRLSLSRYVAKIQLMAEQQAAEREKIKALLSNYGEHLNPQTVEVLELFCQERETN